MYGDSICYGLACDAKKIVTGWPVRLNHGKSDYGYSRGEFLDKSSLKSQEHGQSSMIMDQQTFLLSLNLFDNLIIHFCGNDFTNSALQNFLCFAE